MRTPHSDGYSILAKLDRALAFLARPKSADQVAAHLGCHVRSARRLVAMLERHGRIRKTRRSTTQQPALYVRLTPKR